MLGQAGLLDHDLTDTLLNPVRYLIQEAVAHPSSFDPADHRDVADIQRTLREVSALKGAPA